MIRLAKRAFTLLEICISMALLSMIGVVLGWQVKGMLEIQTFHKSLEHFLVDLKHLQIVAMTHRADLVVQLVKTEKGYEYSVHADEPLDRLSLRKEKLKAVETISQEGKMLSRIALHIYASGVIEPKERKENIIFRSKNREVELDTSHPLRIALCRKNDIKE